jgi:hypothetical protein
MPTIIACPKPFVPPFDAIQERAIRSWSALGPDVQVLLAGDEPGLAEAATRLGVEHVPNLGKTPEGGIRFVDLLTNCLPRARHDQIAYVNADILLIPNLTAAIKAVPFSRYMMAGYRLDLPEHPTCIDIEGNLEEQLRRPEAVRDLTMTTGCDYFLFTRDTWNALPPLVIGRAGIENGLIRKAIDDRIPVIDSTLAVTALHQFHDYSHIGGGRKAAFEGEDARSNLAYCGMLRPHPRDAYLVLVDGRIRRYPWRGDWFHRFFVFHTQVHRSRGAHSMFKPLHYLMRRTKLSCRRDPSPESALGAQLRKPSQGA